VNGFDHAVTDQADQPALVLKICPFCAGQAEVITDYEPTRYGIRCAVCHGGFQPVYETCDEAAIMWNRRSGGISAAGGRATRGLRSRRKAAASKRNLKKARAAKKLKKICTRIDVAFEKLKPLRESEIAQAEEAAVASRARLKVHEARILADPQLRKIYALLNHPQADNADPHLPMGSTAAKWPAAGSTHDDPPIKFHN